MSPLDKDRSAAVRAELERVLNHPLFGHSKRYPALLRYVVEETVEGRHEQLKERTIGIDALGRPASYDTAQDPVVRTTAAEVRKRLAQYYQQAPDSPLRISLPVGSYVAQFEVPSRRDEPSADPLPLPVRDTLLARPAITTRRVLAVLVVLIAGTTLLAASLMRARPSPLERFWSPILAQTAPIVVCVGAVSDVKSPDAGGLFTINATTTASRIVGVLQRHGKPFEIVPVDSIDFADVRARPLIMVGGRNNAWTMRMTRPLRFRFEGSTAETLRIVDSTSANQWIQRADRTTSPTIVFEDYAIVGRLRDTSSGQYVVIAGGLGRYGTSAAGEFLTNGDHMERLASEAPSGWERMNVELVVHTVLTDGVPGPPQVVASHFW